MNQKSRMVMKSPIGLLLLVGAFVATLVVAENCDVNLSRSKCGRLTLVNSGNSYSVIQYNPDNTWKVYTMNNGQLKVTDSSNATPSYGKELDQQSSALDQNLKVTEPENGLTEKLEDDVATPATTDPNNAELQKLLSMPLLGAKFSSESGRLMIDSSNGNKWALKSDNGLHVLYGDPQGKTMAALNLNETSKYSNILLQNGTLATFIDKQCQIETLPINQLSYDQAAEVGNLKRRAAQDNSHHRPDNFRPPPPPPPAPRPFGPFNPFGRQGQQPGGDQGSFYQRAPRFFNLMPYGN